MASHIERLHSLLFDGAAFSGRAVRLSAVRFTGCGKVAKSCRKVALLVVRKVEHVKNCSYISPRYVSASPLKFYSLRRIIQKAGLSSPENKGYLLRGLFFGGDRCYLFGG